LQPGRGQAVMKLVINAASAKMGGNVNYLTHVLRSFASIEGEWEALAFLPSEAAKRLGQLPRNIRLLPTNAESYGWLRRIWWEQVTLRRHLIAEKADALFSTGNFGMFRCPVRQLLLVRNALYFSPTYEETFLRRHRLIFRIAFWLRRWLILRSIRAADIVMTPTQVVMNGLRRHVEVPSGKNVVNPYGAPSQEADWQKCASESEARNSPAKREVRLLFVSLYSEHKNLRTLLKALPLLNEGGIEKFVLWTTADPNWEGARWTVTWQEDSVLAAGPDVRPWVHFMGPLDRDRIRDLYRTSSIFVFPSLVESFGIPLVEAMAWGVPIVAADTPVNREVCGEAAVYFSSLSAEDLARQIGRVSADESLREKLCATGRRRACDLFRWEDHIRRILDYAQS
jgi:glycosyltransferase involved in cell wall biosynthesis